jgi:hypothetical protein
MTKKTTAILTLAAFVLCSTSCMSWRTREVRTTADYPLSRTRVLSVVMLSGTEYYFSKSTPGRVHGNLIVGTGRVFGERVEIEGPFAEVRKRPNGTVYEVVDREGRTHPVWRVVSAGEDKMTVLSAVRKSELVSIPLSEVRSVQLRKLDMFATLSVVPMAVFLGYIALWIENVIWMSKH